MPLANQENATKASPDIEHKIMAPKPVYPQNVSTQGMKISNDVKNELDEHISAVKEDDNMESRENQHIVCGRIDTDSGLVRDAMLPQPEKNGDEYDIMSNPYPALMVENLDEFLAEENNELITYLENFMKRKETESARGNVQKKGEKRKKKTTDKEKGPRGKKVKRLERI